jgi:hypothetical protein
MKFYSYRKRKAEEKTEDIEMADGKERQKKK